MTIISDNVDARVFNAYKMERTKIKRALQKSRRGNAMGNIVTASMQRQNARHNVMCANSVGAFLALASLARSRPGALTGRVVLQTTPAEEAFRPVGEGGCALVRS